MRALVFVLLLALARPAAAEVSAEEARPRPQASAPKPASKFTDAKTGRNDPCPCGSGKKYKKCHGVNS